MANGNMFEIAGQSNLDAARIGFHVAFMSQLEGRVPTEIEGLGRVVESTTSLEEWQWLGDLPGFTEWVGDRKISDIDAFKLQIRNRDWQSSVPVSANNLDDDKMGLFEGMPQELARIAQRHRGTLMTQCLLNGFTGSAFPDAGNGLTYDGALFFSDSHVTSGGPAQSNKMTAALGSSGLSEARHKLRTMRSADGARALDLRGTHLIVGPTLEERAEKLMTAELLPSAAGTAPESNVHRNKYKVVVSPDLVDDFDNYWFLADFSSPMFRPVIFQLREEITPRSLGIESEGGFMRKRILFGAHARYNVGPFAWQTIIGSTGAG